ncbi:hypothetical protein FSP39_005836 [Pinctada imbricata]|uniref:CUE domain-containing protein n=1 Tax=Pinctada imbricata TaxID=66713 RepID=A0AA88YJZ0_PINIB|nr:hypothetical protein FSP39_005836 [Pinctada imbricata]
MSHQKFWCQAIFDESLHNLIDTYLRFAPRSYDVIYELPSEYRGVHDEVHRMIFFTCLRMATHKESKENFLTPKVFGEILYANFLFDVPKLFDLCVLYSEGNSQLLAKMVENIFTQQPNYTEDLRLTVPTLLQVFTVPTLLQVFTVPTLLQVFTVPTLLRVFTVPTLLQVFTVPTLLQVFTVPTLLQVFTVPTLLQVFTVPTLLQVFTVPTLLQVFTVPTLLQVSTVPTLLQVFTVPTLLQVFESIEEKCGIREISPDHSPQKLGSPRADNPVLDTMSEASLQDMVFYLADVSITLSVFVEIYPPSAQVFIEDNFIQSIQRLFYQKMSQAKKGMMKLVHLILNNCFIQPILENRESVERYVEGFLELMATLLNDRSPIELFIFKKPHRKQLYQTRVQYIQDAFSSAFATYGKRRAPTGATNQGGRTSPDGSPGLDDEGGASGGYKPTSSSVKQEQLGACAATVTGVELDSIITSVQDLLPDLGPGFIELCLEEMDYNTEKVINAVLEDKLPPSLQDIDRQLQREPKQVEDSVISSRANIYDHDEFDVFSRESIDTSRIFKGKQSKTDKLTLDEARGFDDVKQRISQAYSIRVETVDGDDPSQMTELYDDEYDDTYDANNVGADDADSADELTTRRPFTTPRVLGGKTVKSESEDDSNSEESGEESKPRDEFITNPALIRQRNEERAQWKAMRRGQGHRPPSRGRGQGQEGGERRYDVKGRGKGQGQSDDVVRNRRWKEQHKSSRGNHNRRFMSDKKRMGFGVPPK